MEIRQHLITPNVERNPPQSKPAAKSAAVERVEKAPASRPDVIQPRTGDDTTRAQA